jgi:hypothetical protein
MAAKLTNQFLPGSRTTLRARELKQPAESGAASRSASGLHGGQFGKDGWSNLRGGHGCGPFEPRHRGSAVARRLQSRADAAHCAAILPATCRETPGDCCGAGRGFDEGRRVLDGGRGDRLGLQSLYGPAHNSPSPANLNQIFPRLYPLSGIFKTGRLGDTFAQHPGSRCLDDGPVRTFQQRKGHLCHFAL